ncbi:MAG TPA: FAD-binding oxidoreductase [Alphaproteobacteria bacterium]|nr:FAD-binding oxidoreductase [Alphaproteobacteria bacterium]
MECDFLIVGAGIAGASAGYELAARGRVILLERESQPGYHSTGRSAAMYIESYGNAPVRAITAASRAFLEHPPAGFAGSPLLSPRGVLYLARKDQMAKLEREYAELKKDAPGLRRLTKREALALFPLIHIDYVEAALFDADAMDLDVHAVHQGFLKGLKARGGQVVTSAELTAAERKGGLWHVRTPAGDFSAPVLINAAGAWADVLAARIGAKPIAIVPKRRTAFIFDPPQGAKIEGWPVAADVDEQFYLKPEAGKFLGSPADETPVEPQDIQPEELDIAIAADRIEKAITFKIARIARRWAGLRSFVADKTLVAGFAADAEGFFWLAGQGGYGIQTSPAMGRIAAALATGGPLPADVATRGVTEVQLAPARCQTAASH